MEKNFKPATNEEIIESIKNNNQNPTGMNKKKYDYDYAVFNNAGEAVGVIENRPVPSSEDAKKRSVAYSTALKNLKPDSTDN